MGAFSNQEIQDLKDMLLMFVDVKNLYLSVFFHKSDLSVVTEAQSGILFGIV